MTSPYVNPITTPFLNSTNIFGTGSSMSGQGGIGSIIQQIEAYLSSMMSGGGFPGMNGGGYSMPGTSQFPGYNPANFGGNGGIAGGFNAQGLRNIKLTTKSGSPLNLQEDMQGNLYNMQGKSVGVMGSDGSVTFNSSAKDEIKQLWNGAKSGWTGGLLGLGGLSDMLNHLPDSSGNVTFSSKDVSVGPGDLPAGNPTASTYPAAPVMPTVVPALQMQQAESPRPLKANFDLAA